MIEQQILEMLKQGLTCKEAARRLKINITSVSAMMTNKFKNMQAEPHRSIKGYVVLNEYGEQVYQGEMFPVILKIPKERVAIYKNKLAIHYMKAYKVPCTIQFFEL